VALFPQGLTAIDARCTPGERRVLHQLKRCLEDDHLVWHDIAIGPRARQPDFAILSPRWGLLLLEVKDWKRASLVGGTPNAIELDTAHGRKTVAHPLRQVRDVAMELVGTMQADPALVHGPGPFQGKLLFPYGWGVAMAGLRGKEVAGSDFAALFPPARTLLREDLDDTLEPALFQRRLWGMVVVSYPHTLSLPQRDRIRWHLFPEVRLGTQTALDFGSAAGSPAPPLPDLMQVMDLQQEQIARSLGEGHRVIHGAAGSGKTMILIFRAQHLAQAARPEQPALVLCFNRTLADRIEHQLRSRGVDERVQVRTFHAWCQDMVRSYGLDVPGGERGAVRGDAYFRALADTVDLAVERGRVPGGQYTAILIDEAHDFDDAWLRIATRMVSPTSNSLLVLYDDAQSIYQGRRRKFNFASVGIEARGRTSILRLNYRNTREVMALAVNCAHSLLHADDGLPAPNGSDDDNLPLVQPTTAGRQGPLPVLIEARGEAEEARLVADRIAALAAEGVALNDIAVLARGKRLLAPLARELGARAVAMQSMHDEAFRRFDWQAQAVRGLTLHSAKGLEFAHVFVVGLHVLPFADESMADAVRLLYVGMTRATQALVLSAQRDSELVRRVRVALAEVSRQAAAAATQPLRAARS
jgi:AAA domain/Nuclease-related domain/UvrD-like helicase C-terminal domain